MILTYLTAKDRPSKQGMGYIFPFAFVPRPQEVSPLNILSKSKHVSFEEGV